MEIILKYFPDLDYIQKQQFQILETLFKDWNTHINVISRKDIDHLLIHHILHSLAIAKVVEFSTESKVLDVGTGGGLPGIPLAILFPNVNFHLIDSIAKKIKVVKEIATELKLINVTTEQIRVENIPGQFDYIVSRAVTNFPEFVNLIKKKIDKNSTVKYPGCYYLKGGDFEEEIRIYRSNIKLFEISEFFSEDFFTTKKIIYYNLNPNQV